MGKILIDQTNFKIQEVGRTIIRSCGEDEKNLAHASDLFKGHISNDFEKWGCDKPQPITKSIKVTIIDVYKKDGTFLSIFNFFNKDLKKLTIKSQAQIVKFVKEDKRWIKKMVQEIFSFLKKRLMGGKNFLLPE